MKRSCCAVALICTLLLFSLPGCEEPLPPSKKEAAEAISGSAAPETSTSEKPKESIETPETRWTKGERSVANAPKTGEFKVKFETSKGDFVILVHRDWAPHGAERIHQLVENKFFDGAPFFRVVIGFMVQFGLNGDPAGTAYWNKNIPDDPVVKSNKPGLVTFAQTSAPNSRSTQIFINYGDNAFLDGQRFAPFGEVIEGMETVNKITAKYAERPSQGIIMSRGNQYVFKNFPEIDYVVSASFVDEDGTDASSESAPESGGTNGGESESENDESSESGSDAKEKSDSTDKE